MLKRIRVQNFKSLKDVDLELRPLNVLIGPNASGKSNLLSVFELLRQGAEGNLAETISDWGGMRSVLFRDSSFCAIAQENDLWDYSSQNIMTMVYRFEISQDIRQHPKIDKEEMSIIPEFGASRIIQYLLRKSNNELLIRNGITGELLKIEMRLPIKGLRDGVHETKSIISPTELTFAQIKDNMKYIEQTLLFEELESFAYFMPFDIGSRAPLKQSQTLKPGITLRQDGSNILSVLTNIELDVKEEIEEYIRSVFPEFKTVRTVGGAGAGQIILEWYEKPYKEPFYINQISDGALRLLYLLALLIPKSDYKLICLEEPELGLHPESIKILASVLKRIKDKGEKQIIVSTHSTELVSNIDVEDVVVTEKKDGMTSFSRLEPELFKKYLKEYSLGQLWVDGLLEG